MNISTGRQTRWKDCYAPSEVVKLTLCSNGEMETSVITPNGEEVQAGFDAPTVDPTLVVSAGGTLAQDTWYAYRYVYASSIYGDVQNAVTLDGQQWPRSNPSGYDVDVTTAANKTITVTVTKTTRSDVDKIVIYRTVGHSTQALAQAAAVAGQMFFIDTVNNNGIAGTTTLVDNGLTDTSEILETDNYSADTFWFCVFDGTYFWGVGNPEFTALVTLNGTNTVVQSGAFAWFDGRNGQKVTFDGITSGGSDGRGTFFFKWEDGQTASLYEDADLTTPATIPYTGTTTIHIQGFASTLYRSKAFNPFSWGFTETIVNDDATTTSIPQSFALSLGGGSATAIAVAGNPRKLKVDFENPQKSISLDLAFAESDQFGATAQDIDLTGSVTSNFAQFHGFIGNDPVLLGIDTYNGNIVAFTGTAHQIVSDNLGNFLRSLDRSDDAFRFYVGEFDPETECNLFHVRYYDTNVRNNITVWIHAPTQEVGWYSDFAVLSTCTILDSDTNERYILGGCENGNVGQFYDPANNVNWTDELPWKNNSLIANTTLSVSRYILDIPMDLSVPLKYSQAVTSAVPASATFVTTSTPIFQVGDSVLLFDDPVTSAVSRTVTAISGNNVTVNLSWTTPTPEYVMTAFTRVTGEWCVIQSPDGKDEWFASIFEGEHDGEATTQIQIDQYIQRGTTTVVTPSDANAPWPDGSRIVFGCIPCYWRTYFDLGTPTKNKHSIEMWVTAGEVEQAEQGVPFSFKDTLTGRYYPEYDEESSKQKTFTLSVNKRQGGTVDSFTWGRKNQVPSTSVPQFGIELAEVGTENFTLYNINLGVTIDT